MPAGGWGEGLEKETRAPLEAGLSFQISFQDRQRRTSQLTSPLPVPLAPHRSHPMRPEVLLLLCGFLTATPPELRPESSLAGC